MHGARGGRGPQLRPGPGDSGGDAAFLGGGSLPSAPVGVGTCGVPGCACGSGLAYEPAPGKHGQLVTRWADTAALPSGTSCPDFRAGED